MAVAIWATEQPEEYSPTISTHLEGVQMRANARRLSEDEYPDAVTAAIEALEPPMPPCAAFVIEPRRVYAPVVDDGVNKRIEVEMD